MISSEIFGTSEDQTAFDHTSDGDNGEFIEHILTMQVTKWE